jgi:hypothetical protein
MAEYTYCCSVAFEGPNDNPFAFSPVSCVRRLQYTELSDVLAPFAGPSYVIADWIPQNDLLAHANTVLFVSHGGYNGISEAAFHGVPTVVIPALSDQVGMQRRTPKSLAPQDECVPFITTIVTAELSVKMPPTAVQLQCITTPSPLTPRAPTLASTSLTTWCG